MYNASFKDKPQDEIQKEILKKIYELEKIKNLISSRYPFLTLAEFFVTITKNQSIRKTNDYYKFMMVSLASKKLSPTGLNESFVNSYSLVSTMWSKELRNDKEIFCEYIKKAALAKLRQEITTLDSFTALTLIQACYYDYAIFVKFDNSNHGFNTKPDSIARKLFKLMLDYEQHLQKNNVK